MARKKVVVVGGTGYLGQHILEAIAKDGQRRKMNGDGGDGGDEMPWDLAFTHNRPIPPPELMEAISPVQSFRVDLRTGEGLDAVSATFGHPDVVVNCAAISVPRACEVDPASAMATNVPTSIVDWLSRSAIAGTDHPHQSPYTTLLIHMSTDQVYEGLKSFYKEEDETVPVNMYGKSKLAGEDFISRNYANYAILRSSIIYGQQTISPVARSLFIQWIDASLSNNKEVEFFFDEYRCPVYVKDLVDVILALAKKYTSDNKPLQLLLNVGGPNRVSRLQMAETVASVRKHNASLIKAVSASSVNRGVKSPPDISMDISKLVQTLCISQIPFEDGVRLTLEDVPN